MATRVMILLSIVYSIISSTSLFADENSGTLFRAGAAMVDVTPTQFPVIVNGMVEERSATMAHDVLMSRAIVMDDGSKRLAIAAR